MLTLDCHFPKSLCHAIEVSCPFPWLLPTFIIHSLSKYTASPRGALLQAWSETVIEQYLLSAYYVLRTVPG